MFRYVPRCALQIQTYAPTAEAIQFCSGNINCMCVCVFTYFNPKMCIIIYPGSCVKTNYIIYADLTRRCFQGSGHSCDPHLHGSLFDQPDSPESYCGHRSAGGMV